MAGVYMLTNSVLSNSLYLFGNEEIRECMINSTLWVWFSRPLRNTVAPVSPPATAATDENQRESNVDPAECVIALNEIRHKRVRRNSLPVSAAASQMNTNVDQQQAACGSAVSETTHARTCFSSTDTKAGTAQRRLAWPLQEDDSANHETVRSNSPPVSIAARLTVSLL